MKLRIGDIIRVTNPSTIEYKGLIGRIISDGYQEGNQFYKHIYRTRILSSGKHCGSENFIFSPDEVEILSNKEALAWLI